MFRTHCLITSNVVSINTLISCAVLGMKIFHLWLLEKTLKLDFKVWPKNTKVIIKKNLQSGYLYKSTKSLRIGPSIYGWRGGCRHRGGVIAVWGHTWYLMFLAPMPKIAEKLPMIPKNIREKYFYYPFWPDFFMTSAFFSEIHE